MAEAAPVTAELVKLMREASGLGMASCKQAADMAIARLDGDYVLALLMADAHSLAVNVRSRSATVSDIEARWAWDLAMAQAKRVDVAGRSDAWARLDAVSGRFAG